MEVAISVVTGELLSRFISFLMNKYHSSLSHAHSEEQKKMVERLQHLLMRAGTIVEEADTRYITISGMMTQLKKLLEAMYQGCRVLDTLRYQTLQDSASFDEHSDRHGDHAPAILPVIGGASVGKKTLVVHVCGDERVHSRFSSILHLNGDNFMMILDNGRSMFGMVLVVITFAYDIGDDDWKKFHSFVIKMGKGSKIIIISRLQRLARFGSLKPIFLTVLSYDELRYLFKTLVFGSVDPMQHPRLVEIADEYAKVLHSTQGSLVATNMFADVLRRNLNVHFWHGILERGVRMVKRNLSIYGVHPTILIEQGHPVDITDFALHPLSMTRYTTNVSAKKELPSVTFGQLITDPSVRPKEDFILISWESRIPPQNSFARFVTSHAQDTHEGPGRKRRGVPM
uniref:Putative disease resistance RPP13-like protein n=1 Tax=Triticum turgidum TaxID=4571 RepID=A0A2L1TFZ2_TRITU|nr:putative disease resistance RPP13-like protein [Triticum turgidum]